MKKNTLSYEDKIKYLITVFYEDDNNKKAYIGLEAYNTYAECCNYQTVYIIDELDEVLGDLLPTDILQKVQDGEFDIEDNYFTFDENEDLKSFNHLNDFVDFGELADYIIQNLSNFDDTLIGYLVKDLENIRRQI